MAANDKEQAMMNTTKEEDRTEICTKYFGMDTKYSVSFFLWTVRVSPSILSTVLWLVSFFVYPLFQSYCPEIQNRERENVCAVSYTHLRAHETG